MLGSGGQVTRLKQKSLLALVKSKVPRRMAASGSGLIVCE